MTNSQLMILIAIVTTIVVGIAVTGCAVFLNFMKKEKERTDREEGRF